LVVETSVLVSVLAGAGSFFSPCILPIIPAFVSYLSGTTMSEIQGQNQNAAASSSGGTSVAVKKSTRLNIFLNTAYFVLGFSLVFAVMGVILNSFLANIGTSFQATFQTIGGGVIIAFGAYLLLSTKIRVLNLEKRMTTNLPRFKTTYLTSFVFGAAFASGWTPCVGPILGTTLTLAATSPGAAYNSLLAYSLGLGVPFLITGAFFSQSTKIIRKMVKHLKYFNPIMGAILITLGVLVLTNQLSIIGNFPLANEIINLERGLG
jgi:cytochrome c-type biogenesis protein